MRGVLVGARQRGSVLQEIERRWVVVTRKSTNKIAHKHLESGNITKLSLTLKFRKILVLTPNSFSFALAHSYRRVILKYGKKEDKI